MAKRNRRGSVTYIIKKELRETDDCCEEQQSGFQRHPEHYTDQGVQVHEFTPCSLLGEEATGPLSAPAL